MQPEALWLILSSSSFFFYFLYYQNYGGGQELGQDYFSSPLGIAFWRKHFRLAIAFVAIFTFWWSVLVGINFVFGE
jgi:hypothetical protein